MTGGGPAAVRIEKLDVRVHGQLVLEEVDLTVGEDAFLAVIGPNGGGKTTLLRAILGLAAPSRGSVRLWGAPARANRHRVGYIPQKAMLAQHFPITVEEVVGLGRLYGRHLLARRTAGDREAVEQALEQVGLLDLRRRQASRLSGGQLQRVLIARALTTAPQLLLLDEPTASLDASSAGRVFETLAELNRTIPIIMVSHDLTAVARHVKSIACLNRRLYYHGAGERAEDGVRAAFEGCPVDLIAHGVPHRVLQSHPDPGRP